MYEKIIGQADTESDEIFEFRMKPQFYMIMCVSC